MATLIALTDQHHQRRECDSTCYDGTTIHCTCVCGGLNHGIGKPQALKNSLRVWIWPELLPEYFQDDNPRPTLEIHPDVLKPIQELLREIVAW